MGPAAGLMALTLRRVARVLTWGIAFVLGVTALGVLYALVGYRRTWDAPISAIAASRDSAVIARGRYIVYGPGRCADCHVGDADRGRFLNGEEPPLTGGSGESTYIGRWSAPNLTPDETTGIGRVTDSQLARMLRYGINRSDRIAPPFMDVYANLAEDDLIAIISFLRSTPPMRGVPPSADINVLGKITLAYFLKPYAPAAPPPSHLNPEPMAEYGGYIAKTLAGCPACHTARNLKTGTYLGELFAGGLPFRAREHPGYVYVSPNLTPDPATGRITPWSEQDFVSRFRAGLLIHDSPMPWSGFARMTDTDLRALYRYLQRLAPVRRDNGPILQREGRQAAG
jgi:mono/diheme cytochrome c family protein